MLIAVSLALIFILAFVKVDIDKQAGALCQAFADNMAQCPAHQSSVSWFVTASFGMAFLILGIGGYITFMPPEKKGFKAVDLSKLDDDEKKVYTMLKSKDGSAYQGDLTKETQFTKVKISRILDRLEQKGITERKRRGMTNLIVLR